MKLMRRYIALCKTYQPVVPEELTEYIVGAYCEMRKDARNNKDTTFVSPRYICGFYTPLFGGWCNLLQRGALG